MPATNTFPQQITEALSRLSHPAQANDAIGDLQLLRAGAPDAFDAALRTLTVGLAAPAAAAIVNGMDVSYDAKRTWNNHQSTQVFTPARTYHPRTLFDLRTIVAEAVKNQVCVRAFGTGHSYSDIAVVDPEDYFVDTSKLARPLEMLPLKSSESAANWVHVEAGIKLRDLNALLNSGTPRRAMVNLGGFTGQSIIGAASTATHGSGLALGSLASLIGSLVIVTERGVMRIEPTDGPTDAAHYSEPGVDRLVQDDRVFNAVSVGMGCMGLIYSVLVRVRPAYLLEQNRFVSTWRRERPRLADGSLFQRNASEQHRHVAVWVNPHKTQGENTVLITLANETPMPASGQLSAPNPLMVVVGALKFSFDVVAAMINAHPEITPGVIDTSLKSQASSHFIDHSWRVLSSDDAADGYACENAVTMRDNRYLDAVEKLFEVADDEANHDRYMSLLSLRFVRRSRAYLAPQYCERDEGTCMIEIPSLAKVRGGVSVFHAATSALKESFDARPHWGLEFSALQGLDEVKRLYPRTDEWLRVFKELNPAGTFDNVFTRRLGFSS